MYNRLRREVSQQNQHLTIGSLQSQKSKQFTKRTIHYTNLNRKLLPQQDISNLITGPGPATLLRAVTQRRTISCPS